MSSLETHVFKCRDDNYGILVHDVVKNLTATIDTPEEAPILKALDEKGWNLTHIFNTHHHYDHVEANESLKQRFDCQIVGPKMEADKIPGIDELVAGYDRFSFGLHEVEIVDCPGHTLGHIAYYMPEEKLAFVGDALFALGCGRIFEGTPAQMWQGIQRLRKMEEDTQIYFGHEYTLANAKFAQSVDPKNEVLKARCEEIEIALSKGEFTCPTTLKLELDTNPFLRPSDPAIREHLNMKNDSDEAVFTEIRRLKDAF